MALGTKPTPGQAEGSGRPEQTGAGVRADNGAAARPLIPSDVGPVWMR
ncbi:hypothetical protein ABEX47_28740 [Paenibacillus ehimensis]|nr:hypothetical protein [Paenibacillus ehimensis]